ncbi:NAD(P)-binding domain-containing protein [Nonomuraea sp. NPDC003804]|uniref:NAD(P)-dependent oxidoreductase n=1 Tax=Nonomuraea sp. NPDC003804 TaxID=3154547 RepID=UPI0033A9F309
MTTHVTVIGLGAMGSAMAETFLKAGHRVTVWNRTPGKAGALVALGAHEAASPAEAGELMVISQVDYQAMYDSLDGVDLTGKVLVNLSSDAPARLREAAGWVAGRGGVLVTGGIMTPPPGIGQPGAYTFYSGPSEALTAHEETLKALSDVTYVGADPGLAMLFYQSQLFMFWAGLTAYMYAGALAQSAGVPVTQLLPYAQETFGGIAGDGPMGYLKILTGEMEERAYPGAQNNLHMQAVGMEHVVHAFADAGLDVTLPEALRDLFARAVADGHAAEGLGSVVESIKKP